jgi:alpha-glucuronidase
MLQDWTRLTFGLDPVVSDVITKISMLSWPAYENYTGNLGIQTLTDITGPHYGPNPASQDNNGWGQWTRADKNGVGMDRTVATGTVSVKLKSTLTRMFQWAIKLEPQGNTRENLN